MQGRARWCGDLTFAGTSGSGQTVTACEVQVSAQRADDIPAVFTIIHLHFVIRGNDVSPAHAERTVRLSADKYCSVSIMPGASVEVTHSFSVESERQV